MKQGTQVVYKPNHVETYAVFGYPYAAQPGFVWFDRDDGSCYVRYWLIENGKPINELRTKANSERTYIRDLLEVKTVPQEWVDHAIEEINEWDRMWLENSADIYG